MPEGDEVVALWGFVHAVQVEGVVGRVGCAIGVSVVDGEVGILEVDVAGGAPLEDQLSGGDVDFLDDVVEKPIFPLPADGSQAFRDDFVYGDQGGSRIRELEFMEIAVLIVARRSQLIYSVIRCVELLRR